MTSLRQGAVWTAAVLVSVALAAVFCRAQSDQATDSVRLPADIYPDSRNRLPLIQRDDLNDEGKRLYDSSTSSTQPIPQPSTEIKLYSPHLEALLHEPSAFVRARNGLGSRLTELAILVTAREFDQQYEWTVHEKSSLKAGVSPEIVDIIKRRRAVSGLPEQDRTIIELGRELFGSHKVSSQTFAAARKLFGPEHLVNLVWLMGHYAATAALLTTFDQQLPPREQPLLPIP